MYRDYLDDLIVASLPFLPNPICQSSFIFLLNEHANKNLHSSSHPSLLSMCVNLFSVKHVLEAYCFSALHQRLVPLLEHLAVFCRNTWLFQVKTNKVNELHFKVFSYLQLWR